jgi:acyl carrier protein
METTHDDDDEFVLIDHHDTSNPSSPFYNVIQEQEITLHSTLIESSFELPKSNIISQLTNESHAPYGHYRIVIQLTTNMFQNLLKLDSLAHVNIYLHTTNDESITIDENVELKMNQFPDIASHWMSNLIQIPSIAYTEEEMKGYKPFQISISLTPMRHTLVQPKLNFNIKLVSEYIVVKQVPFTVPAEFDSKITQDVVVENSGVYCLIISDRKDSGKLHKTSTDTFVGMLSHMNPLHIKSTKFEAIIKSDAFCQSDTFRRDMKTSLFPVYFYHLSERHSMKIACSLQPLKKPRKERNFKIFLLTVKTSDEHIIQCQRLSKTAHQLIDAKKDKDLLELESTLPFLEYETGSDVFRSSFLQADLNEIMRDTANIIEHKNTLYSKAQTLVENCNRSNYEDRQYEEQIGPLQDELNQFDYKHPEMTESRNTLSKLSQRFQLSKQLKQRMYYIQNTILGNNGFDHMTIGVIERESRLLNELYNSLQRAFDSDFTVSKTIENETTQLKAFIDRMEAKRQQIIDTVKLAKERMRYGSLKQEQVPETSAKSVTPQTQPDDVIQPSKSLITTETKPEEIQQSVIPDTDVDTLTNEETIPEEKTDDLSSSTTNPEEPSTSPKQEETKKKKKKKKRLVVNIEERKTETTVVSPDKIIQMMHSPEQVSSPEQTQTPQTPQHPLSNLDPGQVLFHVHQIVKLLLKKSAHQSSSESSRFTVNVDDNETIRLFDNFVFLIVRYILLENRVPIRRFSVFKNTADTAQFEPILNFLRTLSEETSKRIDQFELEQQSQTTNEAMKADSFIRWALANDSFKAIMSTVMHSPKTAKQYNKKSLLLQKDFLDEFEAILDLIEQLQFIIV